ncbi:uncharacterized protein LOC126833725 [Adelges cooleyi]|uniref:uncharacterized protein LOC126833725 n=1 Tax=Adelges cooleyi TaxID=133065 RepID=UPI0021807D4A|nr:uncharacterized protein LOC126833725 [Adelges cooleyi]
MTKTRTTTALLLCCWTVAVTASSFDSEPYHYRSKSSDKPASVAILVHKQQVDPDGGVNFAFAGDDGQQRAERIAPDGSRTGAYSYTSPDGNQVSVRYTAGKDGFRILTGDDDEGSNVHGATHRQSFVPPVPSSGLGRKKKYHGGRSSPLPAVPFGGSGGFSSRPSGSEGGGYRVREDLERSAELGAFNSRDDSDDDGEYHAASTYSGRRESAENNGPAFGAGYAFEFGGRGGGSGPSANADF